ncbi:hypothetical protein AB5I41_27135 [Sphingomonas sp. MMS24-JH45]
MSDAFKLSVEGKFVQATARTLSAYSGTFNVGIPLDNPFIPQTLLDAARAQGDSAIFINRANFDLPRRGEEDRRRTYRGVVDIAGRISANASYDVSYTYGRTDIRATKLNDRVPERYSAAIDAVRDASGAIVCRSAAARAAVCVPLNTFGAFVANPASFAYFLEDPASDARVEQHVVNATLTGDLGQFASGVACGARAPMTAKSSRFRPAQALIDFVTCRRRRAFTTSRSRRRRAMRASTCGSCSAKSTCRC